MFKLDLEKAEGPEIKLLTSAGSLKKQEISRETSISALLITLKPWSVEPGSPAFQVDSLLSEPLGEP